MLRQPFNTFSKLSISLLLIVLTIAFSTAAAIRAFASAITPGLSANPPLRDYGGSVVIREESYTGTWYVFLALALYGVAKLAHKFLSLSEMDRERVNPMINAFNLKDARARSYIKNGSILPIS